MSRPWPTVTCAVCGASGPGRAGRCRRCYARSRHTARVCVGCSQLRRHLAAGRCARCYRLSRTRQRRCAACGELRPVHFGDRCERCKQRARIRLGRCQRCGRQAKLVSARYCRACVERASETVGSCADCLCWAGLLGGRCRPCRLFRWKHPLGACPSCDRWLPLGAAGRCRLCLASSHATGTIPNPASGIQLFWCFGTPAARRPLPQPRPVRLPPAAGGQLHLARAASAAGHARSAVPARRHHQHEHQDLLAALVGYGQTRGWSPETQGYTRRGLVALLDQVALDTVEAPLDAAAVRQFLNQRGLPALRLVQFLADQGLVHVDKQAVLDGWLTRRLAPLPDPIRTEVHGWVEVLRGRGPRAGRARKATTIQGYLRALAPALADWSARYQSLRQVTGDDVAAQLEPVTGPTRQLTLAAMRSLFRALKRQRLTFTNPTAGQVARRCQPTPALGLDPARRAGLLGQLHRPDQRLIVLLAGVHALRSAQICVLTLDAVDLAGGRLLINGRPRRLDALTLSQLRAWLGWRRDRWPATANPYLLINQSTAGGLSPVERSWVQTVFQRLGTTAHQLRVDRLLAEVHTSGGDPLTLAQLFDLSDPTAIRYCAELGPLDHRLDRAH
jgi:hypothetical protein